MQLIDLTARKRALRREVLARRDALSPDRRRLLSRDIARDLLALPQISGATLVLAYLSFGSELATDLLIAELSARGCAIALPRIDHAARKLVVHYVADFTRDTVPGTWGIREPDPQRCGLADLSTIDAAVIPGVAFSPACDRLGYGGGYYDRLLSEWPVRPPLMAAAFDLQVVDDLPHGPNDLPVDVVVTERRTFRRASG